MTAPDRKSISALIDGIYDASLRPERWRSVLAAAAALFEADHAFVSKMQDRRKVSGYIDLAGPGRAVPVTSYGEVIDEDPRQTVFHAYVGRPVHCRMGLSTERLHGSRAYREYLQPLNFEYTLLASVMVGPSHTHSLGLSRERRRQPFGSAECDLLGELVPHLSRSFEIHRALEAAGRQPSVTEAPAALPDEPDLETDLRSLFGLPPSQARLTSMLLAGRSVAEAADSLGITIGSARQYVKRVLQATGARRQMDIARLLSDARSRQTTGDAPQPQL